MTGDNRTQERAELWRMLAILATDGEPIELGFDDGGFAFVAVAGEVYKAVSLAAAVRLAYEARQVC